MGHKKGINLSEKNGQWRGDKVGYTSLHSWVKARKFKSGFCEDCHVNTPRLDLANISQEYLRDVKDWEWLCRLCHMKKDGRLEALIEKGKEFKHHLSEGWRNRKISKGTQVNTNKLTEKEVIKIRELLKVLKQTEIAEKFNVTKSCIHLIKTGANWKWLK